MATAAVTPDLDAVVGEIHIAAPPQRVFQVFTDPTCPIHRWEMDARLGGLYRYDTEAGTTVVNNVREFECHGEIIEFDPPRVLAYTWFGNWHDDKSVRTVVRWELTPKAGGTQVKVTHSGLANLPIARKDYSGGWVGVLDMLKKHAEGRG